MVSKAKTPGLGLPWPDSWKALVAHYRTVRAACIAVEIRERTAQTYGHGSQGPTFRRVREKFLAFGWTEYELPQTRDPTCYTNRHLDHKLSAEDKARPRMCRIVWEWNPQIHWANRFAHAITSTSDDKPIRNLDLMKQCFGADGTRRKELCDEIEAVRALLTEDDEPWIPEAIQEIERGDK